MSRPELRYGEHRPRHLRNPGRSNPFGHVVLALERSIARLSRHLEVVPGDRLLDFGCADLRYGYLFDPEIELVGADLPGNADAKITVTPEGTIPGAEDRSFDAVLSVQVLEHVRDPAVYLAECQRVLRPGGRLLLSTHGVMIYHPDPEDLWRWTWAGLQRVVEDAGLSVLRLEGVMGPVATGLQLLQDGIYHRLRRPLLRRCFGWTMQRLIGLSLRRERPAAPRHNALVFAVVAERPAD